MLTLHLLGPMQLSVDGEPRSLPASRKTRALLAFLALEPRRHRRERLCELLWDIPDDPRAALRWSLTKLRPLLDRPDRLLAGREDVALDGDGLQVDVLMVRAALAGDLAQLPLDDLHRLFLAASQTFLAGSDLPAQPVFDGWISALRHEMDQAARQLGAALLLRPIGSAAQLAVLARMIAAAPHDAALHGRRIALLAAGGDHGEAQRATTAATRLVSEVSDSAAADVAAARAAAPASIAPAPLPPSLLPANPKGILARVFVQGFVPTGHPAIAGPLAALVQAGVADGLARFGSLAVLQDAEDAGDVYRVSGSLVQAGARVRVRCRLADPAGIILWSDEVSRDGEDLIALEDDLTSAIVTALESRIRFTEAAQAHTRPAVTADSLFLRALSHMAGDGDFHATAAYLEQALALNPDHGLSGAYLPWVAMQTGRIDSAEAAAHYAGIARRAVLAARDDVMAQAVGGLMMVLLGGDHVGGQAVIERALQRQPHAAFPWVARGWVRIYAGDSAGAIADFDRVEALSQADPTDLSANAGRGLACFQAGDLDAARQWAQRGLVRSPSNLEALRVGIGVAVEQGRLDDARALAAELLARNPAERASRTLLMPYRQSDVPQRLYDAYIAAGIPH